MNGMKKAEIELADGLGAEVRPKDTIEVKSVARTNSTANGAKSWNFTWNSGSTSGSATVYVSMLFANGNGGDSLHQEGRMKQYALARERQHNNNIVIK